MKRIKKEEREIVVRLGDFHIPFHDYRAIKVALKFVEFLNPAYIVLDEIIDFYSVSKYNKDPKRKLDLQDDIDESIEILKEVRAAVPKAQIVMLKSNHDERLKKYLCSKAEELSSLDCLQLENLLTLDKLRIEYEDVFEYRNVLWKHGSVVRQDSCYTAKAEFHREGMSGVSGHTHRLGIYFKTLRGGNYVWIEGGCLCTTKNVEYIDGTANWQLGLAVVAFKKGSSRFYPSVVPILDYKILWGKRTFTDEGMF